MAQIKEVIKYEITATNRDKSNLGVKDFNNVRLLYSMFGCGMFVNNK